MCAEEEQSGGSTPVKTSTSRARSRSFTGRTSSMDLDDLEPPLRMIGFATNNYFGQQFKVDFNGFRLHQSAPAQMHRHLERRRRLPECPDQGLSRRSAARWAGTEPISSSDLTDPYHKRSQPARPHHEELFRIFRYLGPQGRGRRRSRHRVRRS